MNEEELGLADLFGEEAPAEDSTGLEDLFSDEESISGIFPGPVVPAQGAENSLDDLFAEPASAVPEAGEGSLDDLFADNEVAQVEAGGGDSDLEDLFSDTLGQELQEEVKPEEAQEEKIERKPRPPLVLGQLARPTRTLELKGKPVFDRQAERKKAEREAREKAAQEAAKKGSQEVPSKAEKRSEESVAPQEEVQKPSRKSSALETQTSISEESAAGLTAEIVPEIGATGQPDGDTESSPDVQAQEAHTESVEEVVSEKPSEEELAEETLPEEVTLKEAAPGEVVPEEAEISGEDAEAGQDDEGPQEREAEKPRNETLQPELKASQVEDSDKHDTVTVTDQPSVNSEENHKEETMSQDSPNPDSLDDLFADEPATPSVEPDDTDDLGGLFSEEPAQEDAHSDVLQPQQEDAATQGAHAPDLTLREKIEEAEGSTLTAEALERLRAQAEVDKQERRFARTDSFWNVVDRILALVSADPQAQKVANELTLTRDRSVDLEQMRKLQEVLAPVLASAGRGVSAANPEDNAFVFEMLYDEITGISVLGPLWRDDNVTEILVDGWNKISVETNGVLSLTRITFRSQSHAESVARQLAGKISDRTVSKTNPLVTAELPRARVQFAYGPVVRGGLSVTIRKFRPLLSFEKLLEYGSLNTDMARFLNACVEGKANILVSGGTGTGKTTIINLLSGFIPNTERVVTIEDSFELELRNLYWVPLQTKEKASADDNVSVTLADLLRATLRMRPDRIIVGEIREPAGAEVMIQAANTGHEGTMTTIHANSCDAALNERMSNLLRIGQGSSDEMARSSISTAFQLVVQLSKSRGRLYTSEIAVVDPKYKEDGVLHSRPIYRGAITDEGKIEFRRVGKLEEGTALVDKLHDAGVDYREWA